MCREAAAVPNDLRPDDQADALGRTLWSGFKLKTWLKPQISPMDTDYESKADQ